MTEAEKLKNVKVASLGKQVKEKKIKTVEKAETQKIPLGKQEEVVVEKPVKKVSKPVAYWYGLGRRKTAIAKVKLVKGTGKIFINDIENNSPSRVYIAPLKVTGKDKDFDVYAKIYGGGLSAQLDAIRLGITRALDKFDPELHKTLKVEGFLTRDQRMKERKKPGLKGARRAPQWAKR